MSFSGEHHSTEYRTNNNLNVQERGKSNQSSHFPIKSQITDLGEIPNY